MWFVVALVGLISLVVLILCVPVDAVIEWDSAARPGVTFRIAWLFGMVRYAPRRKKTAGKKPEAGKRKKFAISKALKIITTEGLFGKMTALIRNSVSQVGVREIKGDIRLEFDDPADIGVFYAILGMVVPLVRTSRLNKVRLQAVLGEDVNLHGNARAVFRLQPVRLVGPALKFIFSRPAFSAMRTAIAG